MSQDFDGEAEFEAPHITTVECARCGNQVTSTYLNGICWNCLTPFEKVMARFQVEKELFEAEAREIAQKGSDPSGNEYWVTLMRRVGRL